MHDALDLRKVRPLADQFEFTIDGENVQLSTVDISEIADICKAIHSAIAPRGKARGREVAVTFRNIRSGTVTLEFESQDSKTALEYKRLIKAISDDDPTGLSNAAKRSAIKLSEKAKSRNWSFALRNGSGETALISPSKPLFSSEFIRGSTSLLARIIRAGGDDKKTATITLANGQRLTALVASEEVTRLLGQRLYETIEIQCEARWFNKDGSVIWLKITGIGNYSVAARNPVQAIAELSALSKGIWDKIDPDAFVRDIRSCED